MKPPKFNPALAVALSFAVIAVSSGLAPYEAAAQTFAAPEPEVFAEPLSLTPDTMDGPAPLEIPAAGLISLPTARPAVLPALKTNAALLARGTARPRFRKALAPISPMRDAAGVAYQAGRMFDRTGRRFALGAEAVAVPAAISPGISNGLRANGPTPGFSQEAAFQRAAAASSETGEEGETQTVKRAAGAMSFDRALDLAGTHANDPEDVEAGLAIADVTIEMEPLIASGLFHQAIVLAMANREFKKRKDVLNLARNFARLPKQEKADLIDGALQMIGMAVGDKIDLGSIRFLPANAKRLKMSETQYNKFLDDWRELIGNRHEEAQIAILRMMRSPTQDYLRQIKKAHGRVLGFNRLVLNWLLRLICEESSPEPFKSALPLAPKPEKTAEKTLGNHPTLIPPKAKSAVMTPRPAPATALGAKTELTKPKESPLPKSLVRTAPSRTEPIDFMAEAKKILEGSEEEAFLAARAISRAFEEGAPSPTVHFEKKLRSGLDAFVAQLQKRKVITTYERYSSQKHYVIGLNPQIEARLNGHWAPTRRVRDMLSIYALLADRRPELIAPEIFDTLLEDFSTKLVIRGGNQGDRAGDETAAAALAQFVDIAKAVAARRPDLLPLSRLVRLLGALRENNASDARRGGAIRRLAVSSRLSLEALIEARAREVPIEEARQALAEFDVNREEWLPRRGLEMIASRLSRSRPEFTAALRIPFGEPLEAAAFTGPEMPEEELAHLHHSLPATLSWSDFNESLLRAEDGGRRYLRAHRTALRQPAVSDPVGFYSEIFGLGQLLWTRTQIGARISADLVERTARRIWERHFRSKAFSWMGMEVDEIFSDFLASLTEARRRSPNRFHKQVQAALLEASLLPKEELAAYFEGQAAAAKTMLPTSRAEAVLAAFQEDASRIMQEYFLRPTGNIMSLIVTGSYVYGAAYPDSDLDVHLLTKDGTRAGTEEFVSALKAAQETRGGPGLKDIDDAQVYRFNSPEARQFVREFPSMILSPRPFVHGFFNGLSGTQGFWKTTWGQRMRHALTAPYFRWRLRRRLL